MKKLAAILIIGLIVNINIYAQQIPSKSENIDYLVTF